MKNLIQIISLLLFFSCGELSSTSNKPFIEELSPDDPNTEVEVPRVIERTFQVTYPWGLREGLIYQNGSAEIIHCGNLSDEEKIEISELLNIGLQDHLSGNERNDPLSTTADTITDDDCHKREVYIREGIYSTHELDDVRGHSIDSIVNCINTDGVTIDENGPYFAIKSTCALLEKL